QELHAKLCAESEQWLRKGKLEQTIDEAMSRHSGKALLDWARERFGRLAEIDPAAFEAMARDQQRGWLIEKNRALLRTELTQLERFVLLQILDSAWKDHLYAMDQ